MTLQPPQNAEPSEKKPRDNRGQSPPPSRWVILALLLLAAMVVARQIVESPAKEVPFSRFKKELAAGNVRRVEVEGDMIRGDFQKAVPIEEAGPADEDATEVTSFRTRLPPFGDEGLTGELIEQDVEVVSRGEGRSVSWLIFVNVLPFMLLIGLWVFLLRRAGRQAGGLMSIGRSGARRFRKERTSVTFEDVAGAKEAKDALKEIIVFLKTPGRFTRLGCTVPRGVLLMGPPGTGKTLLARAVAGEADAPFFSITGSDFMEMFVGVGASRVRDLFKTAKTTAPCIVFLDELDSVGRHRGAGLGGGHDEREQTLNQLLSEMDGFEPNDNVIVMAATNRPDVLDPALLRPGRFDRRVVVDLPTQRERKQILRVHARKIPLSSDVDLEQVARSMPGRSGADLANLVNEAALLAARRDKNKVEAEDFSSARDRILMGQPRGGVVLRGGERRATAIHESGHALVAHLTPEADPVGKVSILPRGHALGATQQIPEERYSMAIEYLRGRLKVLMGGRAAEHALLDTLTTGAADDLAQATQLARRMVGQWGMSPKFRHLAFEKDNQQVFLGEQLTRRREFSDRTAREIDLEVAKLLKECFEEALELIEKERERLVALADLLEEEETLEGDLLREALGNNGDAEKDPDGWEQPNAASVGNRDS